jgi:hypothetical protein
MPVTSARRMNPEIVMATTTAAVPVSPAQGGTMPLGSGAGENGKERLRCRNGTSWRWAKRA